MKPLSFKKERLSWKHRPRRCQFLMEFVDCELKGPKSNLEKPLYHYVVVIKSAVNNVSLSRDRE